MDSWRDSIQWTETYTTELLRNIHLDSPLHLVAWTKGKDQIRRTDASKQLFPKVHRTLGI